MSTRSFIRAALVAALLVPASASANPEQPGKTPPATEKKPADATPPATEKKPADATPPATEKKPADAKLSDGDVLVLTELHASNLMEIDMGKTAKARGKAAAVKKYGGMLVTEHQKADKDVLALAKVRGVTLADHPEPRDEADAAQMKKDMETMARLKTLEGAAFDTEFAAAMVDGHTRTIAKVDAAIGLVTDAKLKALLVKVKPVLQKHLDKAKALETSTKQATR